MEAHMKLRPLDLVNEGMYICGLAHSPKTISESLIQARGAVSRAITVLSQPHLMVGGIVSVVDPEKCAACLTCVPAPTKYRVSMKRCSLYRTHGMSGLRHLCQCLPANDYFTTLFR
jgi:heterodisulfide reductase subunit A-like polyferredoxin